MIEKIDGKPFAISLSTEIADTLRYDAATTGRRINFIVEKVLAEHYEKNPLLVGATVPAVRNQNPPQVSDGVRA